MRNAINKPGYREEFKPVDVQTTEVAVTQVKFTSLSEKNHLTRVTTGHRLVKSRKPEAGSRKPEAGSRKPEAGSRKPEAGSRKPEAGSRKPEAGSRKPEAGSRKPEAGSRKPELYLPRGPHASTELVPAQPPARTFRSES